jgi:hypothetical protein
VFRDETATTTAVLQCNIAYLLTLPRFQRRSRVADAALQHSWPRPAEEEIAFMRARLSVAEGQEEWTR